MKRILVAILLTVLLLLSYLFIPSTNVNYDLSSYLPKTSMTSEGMVILEEQFGTSSMIQVLVDDVTSTEVASFKTELYGVDHVSSVIWLDDYVDLTTTPIEYIPTETLDQFYINGDALITITFDLDSYDTALDSSVEQIRTIFDGEIIHMRGDVLENIESRDIAHQEMVKILFLIIPVVIILLFVASTSWIEPVLILITLALAVGYNLTSNGLLPEVSFITQTMCLALQLALSIDYSIFMIHRYYNERKTHEKSEAIHLAVKHSFKPITISALTTIAGFSALALMHFTIGLDIALVLSKGIIFSYLSTMILLPILLYWFDPIVQKSMHKIIFPKATWFTKLQMKFRYVFFGLFIVLLGFSFYLQTKSEFLFGANAVGDTSSKVTTDTTYIDQIFGENNQLVILVPNGTVTDEVSLVTALLAEDHVTAVNALVTVTDPSTPRDYIPDSVKGYYIGTEYTRFIITTDLSGESEEVYTFVDNLKVTISSVYPTYYLVGNASALSDIRSSIESQGTWILLLTIGLVGFIVGIIFKSYKIPLILVTVIVTAIFLNLSYLALTGSKVLYIGYLIVMSIQLGATIDYAVLLTSRYTELRETNDKKTAMLEAYQKSSMSILVSGTILTIIGFIEGAYSSIDSITKIGYMIGRGTLISVLMILIFLPALLYLFDGWIMKKKKQV